MGLFPKRPPVRGNPAFFTDRYGVHPLRHSRGYYDAWGGDLTRPMFGTERRQDRRARLEEAHEHHGWAMGDPQSKGPKYKPVPKASGKYSHLAAQRRKAQTDRLDRASREGPRRKGRIY